MKNKILAAIAVAVLSLSFLGGCGPKINESQPDNYEVNLNVDKNTEATLSVMVPSGDGGLEAKYVEAIAEGFKELFPKVKVTLDYRDISDNGYAASINSAIASGKAPDLFTPTRVSIIISSRKTASSISSLITKPPKTRAF